MTADEELDAEYEYQHARYVRERRRHRRGVFLAQFLLLAIMAAIVIGLVMIVTGLPAAGTAPARNTHEVTMGNCYPTVDAALAAGDQEDSTCTTFVRYGVAIVHGPLWFMDQSRGDIEIYP